MKTWMMGALVAVVAGAGAAFASSVTIPKTFTAGTKAVAADVNADFAAVATAVNDNDARITALEAGKPASKTVIAPASTIPATEGDLATFDVTAPGPGTVRMSIQGYVRMAHAAATFSGVNLYARVGSTKYRILVAGVAANQPATDPWIQPFAGTASFPVGAAGTVSVIVSGDSTGGVADWGDCGAVIKGCPVVTLDYLPAVLP